MFADQPSRKHRVGLSEYLSVVRRRGQFLVLFVVIVVGAVAVWAGLTPPLYRTTATLYFATQADETGSQLSEVVLYPETLIRSYAQVATQPLVLNAVIAELGLAENADLLARSVTADSPLGTVIIEITVADPLPARAAAIANAVAEQLAAAAGSTTGDSALADASIAVSTIAAAGVPGSPFRPQVSLMLATALVWAVLIGVGLCLWLERIDPRVRIRADVARCTPAPLIGALPRAHTVRLRRKHPVRERSGRMASQVADLHRAGGVHSLLLVSAASGDTVTRLLAELGGSLPAAGTRVLVIDADLRPGGPADAGPGLSSVLRGECSVPDAVLVRPGHPPTLPAGPALTDPGAALASAQMLEVLRSVRDDYDLVLLRTAPLLAATASLALCGVVDGVLLVGDGPDLRSDRFRRALRALERAGGEVRGVVLANAR